MSIFGGDKSTEYIFQNDMIRQLLDNGWLLGKPENYNRELALYAEDVLGFVKDTQDTQWQQYCKIYPNNPEQKFLERVASQLNKADPNAANTERYESDGSGAAEDCSVKQPGRKRVKV